MFIQNSFLSFAFIIILLTGFLPLDSLLPSVYAVTATGGMVTYVNGKTIHTFTSNGTFTVTSGGMVEYLVVGGGGGAGGGSNGKSSGGGGAGGYRTGDYAVTSQNYTIIIGAGGLGGTVSGIQGNTGFNGENSIFDTIISLGGGGGGGAGDPAQNGGDGGSGGGGGGSGIQALAGLGGTGSSGQGNNGGYQNDPDAWGGGGGGAGGNGGLGSDNPPGIGGIGIFSTISGEPVTYAKGGDTNSDVNGSPSTGNGAGGNQILGTGKQGGSGVVIISYTTLTPDRITNLSNFTTPTTSTIGLSWTAPSAGGGNQHIIGYQLNVTTPQTNNPLIFVNDTGTTITNYNVTGLTSDTAYSARVSAWTNNTGHPFNNATGNVFNFTTSSDGSIFLDDLGDVVLTTPSQFSILFYNGIHWLDQIFKSNSLTCTAGLFFSGYNNQTGDYTCGTPSSGNLTMLSDVELTTPIWPSILFFDGDKWVDKSFALKNQTPQNDFQITGINNVTGTITTNQFSINTKTCSVTDKISGIDNATGDVICSPDTSGTVRESLVAVWTVDSTKTNIGTSYVNVYPTGLGDPIRIDTNGMNTVTLSIDWTKVGTGTQKCQIVSSTNNAIVLIAFANLTSGLNINATQDIPTSAENRIDTFKPQCFSTTASNDPTWLNGVVLLR